MQKKKKKGSIIFVKCRLTKCDSQQQKLEHSDILPIAQ